MGRFLHVDITGAFANTAFDGGMVEEHVVFTLNSLDALAIVRFVVDLEEGNQFSDAPSPG